MLEFSVLQKNHYCRIILCCGIPSRASLELVLLAQLFLGLPCLDDVSCDVVSLKNSPSCCSWPQSLFSSSYRCLHLLPLFPVLSAFDIFEADGVCQVCLSLWERAGGAICGYWRAFLFVIICPGVFLDGAKAHCCVITSCCLVSHHRVCLVGQQ